MIYCEESAIFGPEVVEYMSSIFNSANPMIGIPDAQHHLTMDQPLAFITALRAVFASWDV